MQINYDLQSSILEAIKSALHPSQSLADELADCLHVSKDSAYRRIRGETLFDIGDIEKLTKKYNLSLDSFFGLKKSSVSFNVQSINLTDFTFIDYFRSIEKNLSIITAIDPKHLYYSARDIPIFHYFQMPELSKFKIFFWLKYYLNHPALRDMKFSSENLPEMLDKFSDLPKRIWSLYLKIPSTEIWTYETPNITLRQIEFAHQAGILQQDSCERLCQKFKEMLNHIQKEAKQGNKYTINSQATLEGAEFNIYFNEVAIGDNSILFKMGERKMAFNTYSNLNYMTTADQDYTDYIDNHFQSTMKNSTLISATAEKIRSNFFNALINKVDVVQSKIHSYSQLY
jgi:BetR domain